jgi:hypothetical protein
MTEQPVGCVGYSTPAFAGSTNDPVRVCVEGVGLMAYGNKAGPLAGRAIAKRRDLPSAANKTLWLLPMQHEGGALRTELHIGARQAWRPSMAVALPYWRFDPPALRGSRQAMQAPVRQERTTA